MELQEFVKDVIVQLDNAVNEAGSQTSREVRFVDNAGARTLEFDIAVSISDVDKKGGKAGVQVLRFVEAGGDVSKEVTSSTVSRVVFGVKIDSYTKDENEQSARELEEQNRQNRENWHNTLGGI